VIVIDTPQVAIILLDKDLLETFKHCGALEHFDESHLFSLEVFGD